MEKSDFGSCGVLSLALIILVAIDPDDKDLHIFQCPPGCETVAAGKPTVPELMLLSWMKSWYLESAGMSFLL